MFAKTEAECSQEKVEEEAYNLGVAETQATLKAQVLGVCRLYCSQFWNKALKQVGVKASSNLWKVKHMHYPSTIREDAPSSFEVRDALEEVEVASLGAALAITSFDSQPRKASLLVRLRQMKVRTLMHPRRL